MRFARPALTLAIFLSCTEAFAGSLSAVDYLCGEAKTNNEGMRCRTVGIDGMGPMPVLIMKIRVNAGTALAKRKRASYVIRRVLDAFLAAGGTAIMQRQSDVDGTLYERNCSRSRRGPQESCRDWGEAETDWDDSFKGL